MRVLVMIPCDEKGKKRVGSICEQYKAEVVFSKREEDIVEADVIIGEPDVNLIRKNKKLRWVQMTWAGTDKYTTSRALEQDAKGFPKDVILTNIRGAFGNVMSEYAIGAILSVYHRFKAYQQQQDIGLWKDAGSEETMAGKTALIIGAGDIGSTLARRLKFFQVYTIGIKRDLSKKIEGFDELYGLDALDQLLPKADIVIGCIPNKPETRGLLTRERLLCMKKDAVLLNMGRGSLLDCMDLYDILERGHLKAAILDVTNPEPLPPQHPLWKQERVMITPHIAGPSLGHAKETEDKIIQLCCENLERYFQGEPVWNEVQEKDFEYIRG